ncbi:hypothetical protein BDP55DRAFT_769683 [Colletotrichum godetiae]|uniref:Uncharacterized protein n=1 Tax=Colletotrichum godetiae TaxID=1209918 RepID=A0AAJ0AIH7_9PEZI|nr:uncharacterized protein BDP55DRAFT_769683 [Colletotrichum godetiae]KAK1673859.1 hypothetical protein BDP55DRAFT_769683 [Colletotrichum godetiae]
MVAQTVDNRLRKIRSSLSLWHAGSSKTTSGWDKSKGPSTGIGNQRSRRLLNYPPATARAPVVRETLRTQTRDIVPFSAIRPEWSGLLIHLLSIVGAIGFCRLVGPPGRIGFVAVLSFGPRSKIPPCGRTTC